MDDRQEQFEQLSAYLDGELKADQALKLEQALADDAELAAELDSLRKTRQLLQGLPAEPAPENFAHNVLAHWRRKHPVGREGLGGPLRASRWISLAAAAIVLFAAGAGMYIVINLPHEPPTELATGPGTPIIVTDLPVEDIFTSDLDAARNDVAEVLRRNGIAMDGRFLAAAGPAGPADDEGSDELPPGTSQAVQVSIDTVEIEVLVSPAVAQQILSELETVQRRQAPQAEELMAGFDHRDDAAREQPSPSPEIADVRDEATEHSYGQDGGPMMAESDETPQQPDDGAAEPPEGRPQLEAADALAAAGQEADTDDDDVESASERGYHRSSTLLEAAPLAEHDEPSGLQAAPDSPADQSWNQQGRADSDAAPDGDQHARPWFGGEAPPEEASRDRQEAGANGPLASENEQGVTAEGPAASADGAAGSAEGLGLPTEGMARQAAEIEEERDYYSDDAFEDAGEERREPPSAAEPPVRSAGRSVDTSRTQPGAEMTAGKLVHLQRLVIVLRRISAEDLPARASQRAGELRATRLRTAAERTRE